MAKVIVESFDPIRPVRIEVREVDGHCDGWCPRCEAWVVGGGKVSFVEAVLIVNAHVDGRH